MRLEAIAIKRLEAIAIRLKAIAAAMRLEAIAIYDIGGHR